ncbi:unnamed protein product [Oikopleura dioica]|uniref:Uncharacterized protein n=1 Tax=Oikopleura dioica TaxID=34765 RepID=E4WQ79_OIKDI|nr:unnamed protein product [Oikopleura dioica]
MNLRLLASICALQLVATYLFLSGFLLRRVELSNRSECLPNSPDVCTLPRSYARILVLLVDAWRYDFAVFDENADESSLPPYKNRMPKLHSLLHHSDNSRLFKIYADPPTTTMQRIKAITTGSFPTFVEAWSNFGADEIMEDNLISSLRSADRSTVFVGDDTWKMLYPEKFIRSYFYPSLDVSDLDTVDFGVYENVPKELQKNDWDLLIGHLLGVDHCGHTYGPYTDHIKYKLTEIDEFIYNVTETLDDDTLLLAFGDHGMTVTGDHGGESSDETDAALFAFSKRGFLPSRSETKINQIDLTSTITLLLDAPIPFGSLGTPITELFNAGTEFKEYQILQKAYQQTLQYLNEYANIQSNFLSLFRISENDFDSSESLRAYLERMRRVLRDQWTKFNLFFMTTGLLFSCLLCTVIFLTSFYGSNLSAHQFALASILAALSTSNSFIIMEDQITLFFVQLVTILQCARSLPTLEWREKFFFAVQIILARLAFEFRRCRPEQFWCYEEGRKVTSVSFVSISIFVAILPIAILTFKFWSRIGPSYLERYFKSTLIPIFLCLWISWLIPVLPSEYLAQFDGVKKADLDSLQVFCSRVALCASLLGLAWSLYDVPIIIRKTGTTMSANQSGITMRVDAGRFEIRGLQDAVERQRCILMLSLFVLWVVLLGPGLSIAGTFFFIDLIISEQRHKTLQTPHSSLETTRLWLLANFYFFATGNTTTFSGVPFNVAGIGLISWPTLVIPGFLVLFNYIGSYLFILAYLTRLPESEELKSYGNILSIHCIRLFGCFISGFLHRRHLMVWGVFAPRIAFEAQLFLLVAACTFLFIAHKKLTSRRVEAIRKSI